MLGIRDVSETEDVMLLIDIQKLIINTLKTVMKIKAHHILYIGT